MRLVDRERGIVLAEVVEPGGILGRMRGLLGETGLHPGIGMLIRTRHVHTIGMRFAIDAVYLTSDRRVLRVVTLAPWSLGPVVLWTRWVLELAAGEAGRLGIVPGMILALEG